MPLWSSCTIRLLLRERPFGIITCRTNLQQRWCLPQQPWRSYTTALPESQRDESRLALPAVNTDYPDEPQQQGRLLERYHEEPLEEDRIVIPERGWRPKRLRDTARTWKYTERNTEHDAADDFLPVWNVQIGRKTRYVVRNLGNNNDSLNSLPVLHTRTFKHVEHVLDRLDAGESTVRFGSLVGDRSGWIWMRVALWLLAYEPRRMMPFLLATSANDHVPLTCIEDSMVYLSRYFEHSGDGDGASNMRQLANVFCILAERHSAKPLGFINPLIRTMVPHCSDEQVCHIYRTVKSSGVHLHAYTYLHLANYFARNDHFEQALDALLEANRVGINVNDWPFLSNCSTVLRQATKQPSGLRVTLQIVSSLVDIGVKLDNPICDIIMLNAVDAGDLKTAFAVYHSLMERGLRPTEYTFAVLLKGCKSNIDDVGTLNEIIRSAISNVNVRKSEFVATEILHCLALHHSKHNPDTALDTLTEAYAQLFDLAPLRKLRLLSPTVAQVPLDGTPFMQPTPHAIGFIVGAAVQHLLARSVHSQDTLPIYERWRKLAEAGEPLLADLATTDHVANIFLVAFICTPRGLIHAARVIRDMQRSLPDTAGVKQCQPTVQSWSIFLHGFTRHGKMKLAEQVLNYMRSKGIQPNDVTWNTLVAGYARVQSLKGTVDALSRAEEVGLVWDRWTYGGLQALRDRQKLQDEIAKARFERNMDFTEDLKEGLGERLKEPVIEVVDGTTRWIP